MVAWAEVTIWNGSSEEAIRFIDCIARNCDCLALKRRCSAHDLMVNQHFLDHALFLRWLYLKEGSDARSIHYRRGHPVHH